MQQNEENSRLVKTFATDLGFDAVGVAPAVAALGAERLARWLEEGRHGEMTYMADHQAARNDPNYVLAGVRNVVVVALVYRSAPSAAAAAGQGRISRYAWGADYHEVLREKLNSLVRALEKHIPGERWRAVVDSAPVMEREYARLAGLGWFGKNTLLLNRRLGSWFFLGALLTTSELSADAPFESNHCGSCTRCLDACPTNAFDAPYSLDPRRCISYLTIEHRSAIPVDLRGRMGEWIFGCDVCQDVCPWNQKSAPSRSAEFAPRADANPVDLEILLSLNEEEFRRRFRGTPLFRAKRRRVLRNACIVAGNHGSRALTSRLMHLADDSDAVVREAAEWALIRIEESALTAAEAADAVRTGDQAG